MVYLVNKIYQRNAWALRIFEPKRDEMVRGWRKLHNKQLHNLYSSPNINRMIKLRGMGWAGYVGCMEEVECISDFGGIARKKENTRKT
jgi:hypothetical protein